MKTTDTENHLEVYGDSDWRDGWPETIVIFNTKTRSNEVYVRHRPTSGTSQPLDSLKGR